jgi:hypothetical protein
MGHSSRYWNIWQISPASDRQGYRSCPVPPAQEFFSATFQSPTVQDEPIATSNAQQTEYQMKLIPHFQQSSMDAVARAQAGLCLRCYVSRPILNACRKIDSLFGGHKGFTYQDLLPFVLNDDGKTLMLLEDDGKTQVVLDANGKTRPTVYKFFSMEILQTFKPDPQTSMSLDNWVYLQTKQNNEIKNFLAEFGFKNISDWALLNRARQTQVDQLSERDRHLVEAFHRVYRRDRRQNKQSTAKCADPSGDQLQEMLAHLQTHHVAIDKPAQLMTALKQVATQLRQYDVWSSREPLELYNPEDSNYTHRSDLPHESYDALDLEQQELLAFFEQQLKTALVQAIKTGIGDRIAVLENGRYAPFSSKFIPGLQQYYVQGLSLKEIAPQLGMTSWDQARRILNPGDLLNAVRTLTLQRVLERVLDKANRMGLTQLPPEPDYLKTLVEHIEAFADAEIFREAAEEIRAGKNRSMQSVYAQSLRLFFEQSHPSSMPREVSHA